MKEIELLWAILPEGLEGYFEVKGYEKNEKKFRIVLEEKNEIGELPSQYRGKKTINTVLKASMLDDFPIRGRKGELEIRKRYWKFDGVKEWYTRAIKLNAEGTKLEKEFAVFLKEFYRKFPDSDLPGRYVDTSELENFRETVQGKSE